MKEGEFEKCWTSEVTFFPKDNPQIMDKTFCKFKVRGDTQAPSLDIYGVDEDYGERLVYQIKFNTRDLMLHVYLSIFTVLESRLKVKSLSDLFGKTKIPVIKPDITKNTKNIIKKAIEEFKKLVGDENSVTYDIVVIDNEIDDIEARIDALVFKLYGLNKDEINTVLDSLHSPLRYQQMVMKYFEGLI